MRQRGEQYREYSAQTAPHVDGRTLDKPVNCALARSNPARGRR
ncbi:hypothetical protein [Sinorhizobium meliloti]|nr:hypothetical protein [Sinorhizobium meliloti]